MAKIDLFALRLSVIDDKFRKFSHLGNSRFTLPMFELPVTLLLKSISFFNFLAPAKVARQGSTDTNISSTPDDSPNEPFVRPSASEDVLWITGFSPTMQLTRTKTSQLPSGGIKSQIPLPSEVSTLHSLARRPVYVTTNRSSAQPHVAAHPPNRGRLGQVQGKTDIQQTSQKF